MDAVQHTQMICQRVFCILVDGELLELERVCEEYPDEDTERIDSLNAGVLS